MKEIIKDNVGLRTILNIKFLKKTSYKKRNNNWFDNNNISLSWKKFCVFQRDDWIQGKIFLKRGKKDIGYTIVKILNFNIIKKIVKITILQVSL